MKRQLFLLLTALMLLSGCARNSAPAEPEQDEMITVGIVQVGAESDWRIANTESMKQEFSEENGYRMLFADARQKQENQILAVRKFIQQKVDYIILLPITEQGWGPVLTDAKEAGIPVFLVDRMVSVDEELYTAHVGSDFYRQGQMAVEWMEKEFGNCETLNIVHIQGTPGSSAQIGRTGALEDAVRDQSGWKILVQLDGDYTQPKAYSEMNGYLNLRNTEERIDVVYCENDNEAFGAIQALEEHGYVCGQDVKIISFDATHQCLELVMEGKIAVAVECNPLLGPCVGELVQKMERGEIPEKQQYIEEQTFTRDNVTGEVIAGRGY